ncbi:hypothetical protein M405DRAFT_558423 [Rhizopogon salebrosus TDB-379]|nr:hypothetical protein M405DRAFT_558423 [Rhizopogon salebrosus TDB-379]
MAPNPAEAAVSPPTHDGSDQRTHMGINHPPLARFLYPIDYISERSNGCKRSRLGRRRMHVWSFFGKVIRLALIMTLTIWLVVFSKVSHSNI